MGLPISYFRQKLVLTCSVIDLFKTGVTHFVNNNFAEIHKDNQKTLSKIPMAFYLWRQGLCEAGSVKS
jgi:hypothetical protein